MDKAGVKPDGGVGSTNLTPTLARLTLVRLVPVQGAHVIRE